MILVKIELHSFGKKAREIGRLKIVNNLTAPDRDGKDSKYGNYTAIIYRRGSRTQWKEVKIEKFPRLHRGGYDLLYRVLKAAVGKRNT